MSIKLPEMIKAPGLRIFKAEEVVENDDVHMFYCEFCAGRFHIFKDHMDQVVCEPLVNDRFNMKYHSTAMRCTKCRAHGETKTFNGRVMVDPEKFGQMDVSDIKVSTMPKRKVVGLHGWHD